MKIRINNKRRQTYEFNSMNKYGFLPHKIFHLVRAHDLVFDHKIGKFINDKITLCLIKNSNENTYFAQASSNYDETAHFHSCGASPHFIIKISKLLASIKFTEPNFQTEIMPKTSKKRPNIKLTQIQDNWELSDFTTATYLRIPQKYGTKIISKTWTAFIKFA